MVDPLSIYNKKRDFQVTAEPKGKAVKSNKALRFVIQLHEATRTHYDFRLEWGGVMKSWAVTKGPSYDPADKRLAVRTEDHPIDYNTFEGVIPDKQYGAGPVMIWDEGLWHPIRDPDKMEKKGHITFIIEGGRMRGEWHLVRMNTKEKRENWLLIKGSDADAMSQRKAAAFLKSEITSAVTGRNMAEIRAAGLGNTAKIKKSARIPAKKTIQRKTSKTGKSPSPSVLAEKFAKPELATLVANPPSGPDWVHEIKYDGYRLIGLISNGSVMLRTRGGKDWTHKFQPLAQALSRLDVTSAVLDMEACVRDSYGRTDFSMLQKALTDGEAQTIEGFIFDMLYLDGEDIRKKPLIERKTLLAGLLKKPPPLLYYSEHYESAPDLLPKACKVGVEGIISKRKDSLYHGRRSNDWLKSKCGLAQEFVIGGFMPAKDDTRAVGAILLGYYKDKKFTYAGKVGTGFTRQSAKDIYKKIIALKTADNPFPEKPPRGLRPYVFTAPEILCEVSFMEWTPDGHIRHGTFKGLREDKKPVEVIEEKPQRAVKTSAKKKIQQKDTAFRGVKITHPERDVFPDNGVTKADVAAYYDKIAPLMMPFVEKRLISLLRCTDGIKGECFFQRNPMRGMGDQIHAKKITHKGKKHEYLYVDDPIGLMQLVQMGTMEFHAWQSRVAAEAKPDQIIFDLDPADDVPFEAVKLAAEDIKLRLTSINLKSFARLSGGKGIHVVVPVKPEHRWENIKEYARAFSEQMARDVPDAYVANMSKAKRKGKIFIDFFRNDFSSTAIVPFSTRARDGAPLAWPVSWTDLKKCKTAADFTLLSITAKDMAKAKKESEKFLSLSQRIKI